MSFTLARQAFVANLDLISSALAKNDVRAAALLNLSRGLEQLTYQIDQELRAVRVTLDRLQERQRP